MALSKGHLDDLLHLSLPYADFQSVAVQSFTTDTSNASNDKIDTMAISVQSTQPLGIYPFGPYTVTSIDDVNNTFLVSGYFPGASYSVLYYVLGFSGDSLIFGTRDSHTIANFAPGTGTYDIDTNVGILSPTPVTPGTVTTYNQVNIDANVPVVKNDFNGDGRSDILLQNDNGAVVIETTTGLSVTGGGLVTNPGPTWHLVGSADFNGDGQNDLLFQNDNGTIVDYLLNGATITAGYSLTAPGPTWHVRGTGDFNADGKADLVLQNDAGTIVVETTDGVTITGGTTISNPGPDWTVEGVADFNGDGKPDLLLQNRNGTLVDYLMDGTSVTAGHQLLGPNVGYSVAGTGDYNGDNHADILLHNDLGTDIVLYTDGNTATGASVPIGNLGADWTGLVGGIDLNGDGRSDLLLANTSGTLAGYTLDGTATMTSSAVLTTAGPGWRAMGGTPMQFIDGTGAAPTLSGTAGIDEFNFSTFTPGIHTITNFDAAIDLIALSTAAVLDYQTLKTHEIAYNGGTAIGLTADTALVIQGVTPDQLSSANFVLR